ncbi:MAG: MFS transporter [Alphaproteobacteria bacterium]|jgi:MFS family permease|nr:MFS transporter [Alphaproteobacteria bacterium]
MSSPSEKTRNRLKLILAMIPALGLAFILSQFLRSVPAVIAPDLRAELDLTAGQLSALPAALFFGSAIMQLPSGVLLDRFGPRRTIAAFLLVTACGVAWFAVAHSVIGLTLALLTIGWGIAPVFMGIIVLITRWISRDRLATASALAVGFGGTGMLLSASPFAEATAAFGWRPTLLMVAGCALVMSLGVILTVRDRAPDAPIVVGGSESLLDVARGLNFIFREPKLYAIGAISAITVGSFLTFRALWVGPYLNDTFGSDLIERGNIIFVVSLAWLVSAICIGPLDRIFDTRRGIVTVGALSMALWFAVLSAAGNTTVVTVTVAMVLLGLSSGLSSPIFAHVRSLFPDRYVGRVVTAINLFIWGGVFLVQVGTGLLIDAFPADELGRSPFVAYRVMFAALAVLLIAALLFYRRIEDVPPSRDTGEPDTQT